MNKLSRRALAGWAADQLIAGTAATDIAKHLVATLIDGARLNQADFLMADIAWELEQRQALAIGRITTATPLTEQLERALIEQIKQATKADQVSLDKKIDKTVIGGVRIETASHIWDHTVSRKLSELREV
jgi:F-type H+-transporting ATPase subunit delta